MACPINVRSTGKVTFSTLSICLQRGSHVTSPYRGPPPRTWDLTVQGSPSPSRLDIGPHYTGTPHLARPRPHIHRTLLFRIPPLTWPHPPFPKTWDVTVQGPLDRFNLDVIVQGHPPPPPRDMFKRLASGRFASCCNAFLYLQFFWAATSFWRYACTY